MMGLCNCHLYSTLGTPIALQSRESLNEQYADIRNAIETPVYANKTDCSIKLGHVSI